jgi:hypothetical protein
MRMIKIQILVDTDKRVCEATQNEMKVTKREAEEYSRREKQRKAISWLVMCVNVLLDNVYHPVYRKSIAM